LLEGAAAGVVAVSEVTLVVGPVEMFPNGEVSVSGEEGSALWATACEETKMRPKETKMRKHRL
jgi:hypothetical protein